MSETQVFTVPESGGNGHATVGDHIPPEVRTLDPKVAYLMGYAKGVAEGHSRGRNEGIAEAFTSLTQLVGIRR